MFAWGMIILMGVIGYVVNGWLGVFIAVASWFIFIGLGLDIIGYVLDVIDSRLANRRWRKKRANRPRLPNKKV